MNVVIQLKGDIGSDRKDDRGPVVGRASRALSVGAKLCGLHLRDRGRLELRH